MAVTLKSIRRKYSTHNQINPNRKKLKGCFRKVCCFSYQSINVDIALFRASFRLFLIEIKKVIKSKGSLLGGVTLKIYYGEQGGILDKYEEFYPKYSRDDYYFEGENFPDYFDIVWKGDKKATVNIISENESGEAFVADTI